MNGEQASFANALKPQHWSDVELLLRNGTRIKSHKVVLYMNSTHFQWALDKNMKLRVIVVPWDFDTKDVITAIQFYYDGVLDPNNISDRLEIVAEKLGSPTLLKAVQAILRQRCKNNTNNSRESTDSSRSPDHIPEGVSE